MTDQTARTLKMLGMALFLVGLITGFLIMNFTNPRQGLAAHLEGVMNGTFLVVTGFVWNELRITVRMRKILFGILVYGTFANWVFTTLGAILGTSRLSPIAGEGYAGTSAAEAVVAAGLISVGLTMVIALALIVYGLRGRVQQQSVQ